MNEIERIKTDIKKLSTAQTNAIVALLECNTVENAAKKAKIGKVTLYKWLKDPEFLTVLDEGRETLFNEAIKGLKAAATLAKDRLIEIVKSDNEGQARLAAVAILRYSIEGHEIKDIEERLTAIEAILEQRMIS